MATVANRVHSGLTRSSRPDEAHLALVDRVRLCGADVPASSVANVGRIERPAELSGTAVAIEMLLLLRAITAVRSARLELCANVGWDTARTP